MSFELIISINHTAIPRSLTSSGLGPPLFDSLKKFGPSSLSLDGGDAGKLILYEMSFGLIIVSSW